MARVKFFKSDMQLPQDLVHVYHDIWYFGKVGTASISISYRDTTITLSKKDAMALASALETAIDTFDTAVEISKEKDEKETAARKAKKEAVK